MQSQLSIQIKFQEYSSGDTENPGGTVRYKPLTVRPVQVQGEFSVIAKLVGDGFDPSEPVRYKLIHCTKASIDSVVTSILTLLYGIGSQKT